MPLFRYQRLYQQDTILTLLRGILRKLFPSRGLFLIHPYIGTNPKCTKHAHPDDLRKSISKDDTFSENALA